MNIVLVRNHPSSIEKELQFNQETRTIQTVFNKQESCSLRIPEWYVKDVLISQSALTLVAPVDNGVLAPLENVYYYHLCDVRKRLGKRIFPIDLSGGDHGDVGHFHVNFNRYPYTGVELFDKLGVTLTVNF